ncbi:MAG: diguanylate cyclase with sensor [Rhizorhabdus sp.]|nr:diguanylate cyclase with sensor [Rhizorhabdus sp.]
MVWRAIIDRNGARSFAGPLAVGIAYYAAAALSLALTRGLDGIATIWPASGIMLATLLFVQPARRARYIVVAAIASMAANLISGTALWSTIGFTIANMAEALLATWLIQRGSKGLPSFVDPAKVGRFCLSALGASAFSAALAATLSGSWTLIFLLSWFTTDAMGMLILVPIILTALDLLDVDRHAQLLPASSIEASLLLAAVAAVTIGIFAQASYPLLFLPLVAVLVATYRLGPFGAAASVMLIALIGSIAVAMGYGPLALIKGQLEADVLFFQFYILVLLGSALPLAALLATRDALHRQLAESVRMLAMAERSAQVGHWRLNLHDGQLFWSDEVFRIHGREPGQMPKVDEAILAYHPEDQARVRHIVRDCVDGLTEFEFEARLIRADGETRYILSRGGSELAPDGTMVAVFGTIQDVTIEAETKIALAQARSAAEDAARRATAAADTDQLTGIASRRKTMQLLDDALALARTAQQPLSVAIFDIDHFKRINDLFGHHAGDRVLRRVASTAQATLRTTDIVGRIGGEEFVMLLPGADADTAMAVAERVRSAIAGGGTVGLPEPQVTASIGVATFGPDLTAEALLHRADCALYEAKRAGRNALRLAPIEPDRSNVRSFLIA